MAWSEPKYTRETTGPGGHAPRCDCAECNQAFREHNSGKLCGCADCAMHREIGAPAPPTTVPAPRPNWDREYASYRSAYPQQVPTPTKLAQNSTYGKRQEMSSTLHMCERPECNALIKGKAVGAVQVRFDSDYGKEQTIEAKEICPACVADIVALLDMEPVTPRERAYDKPYERPADTDSAESMSVEQLAALLFQKAMKQAQIEGPKDAGRF
jgi:hypothetical protein